MTSVKSLTSMTWENHPAEPLFYLADDTGHYKATRSELAEAIGARYIGAMYTDVNCVGIPNATETRLLPPTLEFDTGSFTDSNSVGIFYINQAPTYTHVQLGFQYFFNEAQTNRMFVCSAGGTAPLLGSPAFFSEGLGQLGLQGVSAPIPVSSGDTFSAVVLQNGFSERTRPDCAQSGKMCFWIRGLGKA